MQWRVRQGRSGFPVAKKSAPTLVKPANAMYKPVKFPKSACVSFGPRVGR